MHTSLFCLRTSTSSARPLSFTLSGTFSASCSSRIQAFHRPFAGTRAPSSWHLGDLQRASKEDSPLIFRSTSTDPYHNLSIEDYLLRHSDHSSHILLFYVNRPCVVIGRNQNPWVECDLERLQAGLQNADDPDGGPQPIPLLRRRSGGGTVFHDLGNLNYSVIVPNNASFNRRKHAEMVVRALVKLQQQYTINAEIKVSDRHDIVLRRHGAEGNKEDGWSKISGSAFKLTKGRALHHGTLLFASENLGSISGLLRGQGREHIRAMGVESVRSKVANLAAIKDVEERDRLRDAIIDSVSKEFAVMYDRPLGKEPTLLGDYDATGNAKVATGMEELMTDEWRFGQTPRFDFSNGPVDGFELGLHANRGLVERVTLKEIDTGEQADRALDQELRIWEIQDWSDALENVNGSSTGFRSLAAKAFSSPAMVRSLQAAFPYAKISTS